MSKHKPDIRGKIAPKRPSQPPWLIAGIGLVLLAGAVIVALATRTGSSNLSQPSNFTPQVAGAPRLTVLPEQIDHGYVKLNTTIDSVFEVHNDGDKPLQILGEPRVEVIEGC
jgi:hypothetical protein